MHGVVNNRRRWSTAIGLALLIECGLVAGLNRVLANEGHATKAEPVTVVFERPQPLPTVVPPPPRAKPQPPVRRPEVQRIHPVPVVVVRPPKPVHQALRQQRNVELARSNEHAPAADVQAPAPVAVASAAVIAPLVAQVVVSSPPVAPSAAPTPAIVSLDPGLLAAYNQKLTAAVQAAFHAPSVASDMGFKGRVRIEFTLRDGVVTNVRVDVPSGLTAVDRAAVHAVQVANYPIPPQALIGKNGTYQIWVACI
jgi:periplasmic protein TonB